MRTTFGLLKTFGGQQEIKVWKDSLIICIYLVIKIEPILWIDLTIKSIMYIILKQY
jgi:hypothetical protein